MASEILNKIIKNYSSKFSNDLIKYDLYSRFNLNNFEIVKKALSLKEQKLSRIECFSCDENCDVRLDEKNRFIHCIKCDAGRVNLSKNQDLAYFLEFNNLADFLIEILNIKNNKKDIKLKELVYLGDLKLSENSSLSCSFYLSRISRQDFITENIKLKNYNISFIINLCNTILDLNYENFIESDLQSIISFNEKLKKFSFNEGYFKKLLQPFLMKHNDEYKMATIKESNKKYAEGGKKKRKEEREFFISKFHENKQKYPNKEDKNIIIEMWEENKNERFKNLSKARGLQTLKNWKKKYIN
jgi:hypothetical protein